MKGYHFLLIAILLLAFSIPSGLLCANLSDDNHWVVVIPKTSTAPVIDGDFGRSEWQNSVTLPTFRIVQSGLQEVERAVPRLMYDETNLYICFDVDLQGGRVPKQDAQERDGAIQRDDAVEVFLSPGRQGNTCYRFAVNPAGQVLDSLNADQSYNIDWKAKTSLQGNKWIAEIAIPFKSMAVRTPEVGDVFGANFGHDRAGRYDDFSLWITADSGVHDQRPEDLGVIIFGDSTGKANDSDLFQMRIRKSLSQCTARVLFDASLMKKSDLQAKVYLLDSSGKPVRKSVTVMLEDGEGYAELRLPKQAGTVTIKSTLMSGNRKICDRVESFDQAGQSAWQNTKAGLSNEVLQPFTPMQSDGSAFSCWGRTYDYSNNVLPVSIKSRDQQILSNPIELTGMSNGSRLTWNAKTSKVIKTGKTAITYEASAKYGKNVLSTRSYIEYDGCIREDLSLRLDPSQKIDKLWLEIPIKAEFAKYWHISDAVFGSDAGAVGSSNWYKECIFQPYVWLGDESRGLAWFAETDEPFMLSNPNSTIQIKHEGDRVVLRINLIDHQVQGDGVLHWTFGLQATPVKPETVKLTRISNVNYGWENLPHPTKPGLTRLDYLKEKGAEVLQIHQQWTMHYGYPSTPWTDKLKSLVQAVHDRKMKIILYIGYGLGSKSPEMDKYHDEWTVWPVIFWGGPPYPPEQWMDAACNKSNMRLFMLNGVDKLVKDYNIDGLYFDGTTQPFPCKNYSHGCGYFKGGQWHATYPVWETREYIKRLATIARQGGRPGFIEAHTSANMTIPTLSFCDNYLDGEQWESIPHGKFPPQKILPLEKFRAEFMGKQYGLRSTLICLGGEGHPFTTDEELSMTLLHDSMPHAVYGWDPWEKITSAWQVFDSFGTDKSKWIPYWQQDLVKISPSDVYCSIYTRPDKGVLMVVSNQGTAFATATLHMDLARMGLPNVTNVRDATNGNIYPIGTDSRIDVPLDSMKCVILRIGE